MKLKISALIISILIVLAFVIYRMELQNNTFLKSGRTIWHGNMSLPKIALTFDDGPSRRYTPQILDILKTYKIKATFFVVGRNIKTNENILLRMDQGGHSICNHTYYHIDGKTVKAQIIYNNINWTDVLINKVTGKTVRYFRPPFGYENWRFLEDAEKLGHDTVMWSVDAGEWNENKSKDEIVSRILNNTKNGSIILLHDGGKNRENIVKALPEIIRGLKSKGFEFVTIPELVQNLD